MRFFGRILGPYHNEFVYRHEASQAQIGVWESMGIEYTAFLGY